jgi:hypothetical protein
LCARSFVLFVLLPLFNTAIDRSIGSPSLLVRLRDCCSTRTKSNAADESACFLDNVRHGDRPTRAGVTFCQGLGKTYFTHNNIARRPRLKAITCNKCDIGQWMIKFKKCHKINVLCIPVSILCGVQYGSSLMHTWHIKYNIVVLLIGFYYTPTNFSWKRTRQVVHTSHVLFYEISEQNIFNESFKREALEGAKPWTNVPFCLSLTPTLRLTIQPCISYSSTTVLLQ